MWTRASHKKKECWHYNSSNYGVRICAEHQGKKYSSPHFALIVASMLFFGVVNCSKNNLNITLCTTKQHVKMHIPSLSA